MRHLCVVGLQWGDEGKGKIVDVIAAGVDAVVRYQGGANAGHTVFVGDRKYVTHHLPTGVLQDDTLGILGNGMVIDPATLIEELDEVGMAADQRLYISSRAHVVLPTHRDRDRDRESRVDRSPGADPPPAEERIGTTLRGIGPAYEDKYGRRGVRVGDLIRPGFLEEQLPELLAARGCRDEVVSEAVTVLGRFRDRLGSRVCDTQALLETLHQDEKRLLFEGAQGTLLDIDFGTYPFVTSSSASFLGLGPGCGFSPRRVDHVVGVTKAYCTRVGEGPFPSELGDEEAGPLREAGGEFGATTGRPRRCGWLDLVALSHTIRVNDVDSLALTKSDVLSGRRVVPVVVGYRLDGQEIHTFPAGAEELARVEPVVEEWPGWPQADPDAMAPFLDRLHRAVGVPVSILSTGRRREEVLIFEPLATYLGSRR